MAFVSRYSMNTFTQSYVSHFIGPSLSVQMGSQGHLLLILTSNEALSTPTGFSAVTLSVPVSFAVVFLTCGNRKLSFKRDFKKLVG